MSVSCSSCSSLLPLSGQTKLKKRVIRDILIEEFVMHLSVAYQLSRNVSLHLLSIIIIGLVFKNLHLHDFKFEGNRLQSIRDFHFLPKRVYITRKIFGEIKDSYDTTTTTHYQKSIQKKKTGGRRDESTMMSRLKSKSFYLPPSSRTTFPSSPSPPCSLLMSSYWEDYLRHREQFLSKLD